MGRVGVFICAALLLLCQHKAASKTQPDRTASVHTVITTECTPYFDWQILGLVYSFKRAKQPGSFTRLLSCTEEQLKGYKGLDLVPTHVVPSLTIDPNKEHNDHYSAYNKPGAVLFWLQDVEPEEDYILVIDADMIFRSPFIPEQMGVSPGWAVSAYFGYLKGVSNELALKHVPYVVPRNDTLAGPRGRRGDQVGGFCIMHKEDLKRVAPLWLKFSKAVRHDPDAWNLTGDAFTHNPGDKPWISEMYGYSFGTASADVWHHVDYEAMLYPGYTTYVPPKVLHYGLHWEVGKTGYEFDKHWFYDFDALQCPPWNLTGNSRGGLFRHPPHPATYPTKVSNGFDLLVDMLAAEPMIVLNAAFCELHRKRCPPSEQLLKECSYAEQLMRDFDSIASGLQLNLTSKGCLDKDERCPKWAGNNECITNPSWMKTNCRLSCGTCPPPAPLKQASVGVGGKLRGIGSLLGLGGEGRWPQQKAVVSEIAALEDASGTAVGLGDRTGEAHQLLLGGDRRALDRQDVTSDVASFLHRLGWVGLLLWCGTAALFLTFLPSRRLRRSLLRNGAGSNGSVSRPATPSSTQKHRRSV
ncbi:Peptidyl serine alpha-galactosyltransferase [Coccomyxa sp. Obi]|nr:Peptidyl serine alpha-galactosyltransferase [Coccomyxa sp. Obi]